MFYLHRLPPAHGHQLLVIEQLLGHFHWHLRQGWNPGWSLGASELGQKSSGASTSWRLTHTHLSKPRLSSFPRDNEGVRLSLQTLWPTSGSMKLSPEIASALLHLRESPNLQCTRFFAGSVSTKSAWWCHFFIVEGGRRVSNCQKFKTGRISRVY